MAVRKETRKVAQAWIELKADDLEAVSAFEVAKSQLAAGQHLQRLRRIRLIEIEGRLPAREKLEELLHGSTQFYNPHKERCVVRLTVDDPPPLQAGERAVLVTERDGTQRAAAERWWEHETGDRVSVREGTAWALRFDSDAGSDMAQDLAMVRGRRHGLLCNPHSQECRWAEDHVPVPWIEDSTASQAAPPRRRISSSARSKR